MAIAVARDHARRLHVVETTEEMFWAQVYSAIFFFIGVVLTIGIDKVAASFTSFFEKKDNEGDVEISGVTDAPLNNAGTSVDAHGHGHNHGNLAKVSMVAFIGLTLHNFPEGMATFFSGSVGNMRIVFAVAMHNIPEGAAIAIPLYQSSGENFVPPLVATTVAGLAQPMGALVGYIYFLVNDSNLSDLTYGAMFAITAGIMIAVSIVGLLPEAYHLSSPLWVSSCVFMGFLVMELTMIFLSYGSIVVDEEGDAVTTTMLENPTTFTTTAIDVTTTAVSSLFGF